MTAQSLLEKEVQALSRYVCVITLLWCDNYCESNNPASMKDHNQSNPMSCLWIRWWYEAALYSRCTFHSTAHPYRYVHSKLSIMIDVLNLKCSPNMHYSCLICTLTVVYLILDIFELLEMMDTIFLTIEKGACISVQYKF